MKRHLHIALASLTLASTASGEEIRQEAPVVTSPSDDYISLCGWEFDVDGGGYSTCSIDLDGDGLLDQMFANAATSGSGGKSATVYLARKDGKFSRIGAIGHGSISTEAIKTGSRLLHCSWSFGGGSTSITTYLISHDGLKELMVIGGNWDDDAYRKRFKAAFEVSLKPDYRFVAARPKPAAKQDGDGQPSSRFSRKSEGGDKPKP
jgi:hypothetical protein